MKDPLGREDPVKKNKLAYAQNKEGEHQREMWVDTLWKGMWCISFVMLSCKGCFLVLEKEVIFFTNDF